MAIDRVPSGRDVSRGVLHRGKANRVGIVLLSDLNLAAAAVKWLRVSVAQRVESVNRLSQGQQCLIPLA